ncbi:LytR/AlgR family response regulator transcription factor [Flavobacterium polysaccharolyticum]|uniref:LytTR family DNA-binding domain-containing protein n=1 Tax=Flavobacterium polysaccharolyticum TaxID=3133148 RepID=A0ABU9NLT0_9FLAO
MSYTYIIIDDSQESALHTKAVAQAFSELEFQGMAFTFEQGLNLVIEKKPHLVFLEIVPSHKKSNLSLAFISEMHRFLTVLPEVIITTDKKDWAFEAIYYSVFDYYLKPIQTIQISRSIHKLRKKVCGDLSKKELKVEVQKTALIEEENQQQLLTKPLTICIKSYGDYRYINANDICYFQADNNSTDIHLNSGEMITAFKTLKHFESILTFPFIRIHKSYIVNRNSITRIQMGNSLCFIKNSNIKLPFSKLYKPNIDLIISYFSKENYVEI